jgi:hypothetical protein
VSFVLCVGSSFLPLVIERLVEQKVQVNAAAHEVLDAFYENVSFASSFVVPLALN